MYVLSIKSLNALNSTLRSLFLHLGRRLALPRFELFTKTQVLNDYCNRRAKAIERQVN